MKNMWTAIVSFVLVSCFFIFLSFKKSTIKNIALIIVLTPHLSRKMSNFAHCVLFYSTEILKMAVKTLNRRTFTDDEQSGLQVVVKNNLGEECTTSPMNNPGETNYVKGQKDIFEGSNNLGSCFNFRVPNHVSIKFI